MGTNYYARYEICECCKRYEELHIGKSSAGWSFSFRGYSEEYMLYGVKSFDDWKRVIKEHNMKIYDEYGNYITLDEFIGIVESKKGGENLFTYSKKNGVQSSIDLSVLERMWLDNEGNSFSDMEFF